ncbi:MAG TPA: winged helix-turn-helix domain-containing protein [Terracidiphilus sp.]|nr:winged helix-turn-helix domain-containing protein [Terracidiphilus sp.]
MRFDSFELDEEGFQLREDGRPVRLERIPLELGILLARNPARLVTREEIVARIWGVNHFLESDSAINTAMRKLRRALRDDPAKARLIETVPGKGYRFIGVTDEASTGRATDAPDPEAMRCFLRGRHAWNKKTAQDYEQAIEWFQQAIDRDAAFAPPLVGLAYCYLTMGIHGLQPAGEVYPRARAAAQAALEIDAGLAEAVTALADVSKGYDWDFVRAEEEYLRALQLNPDYAVAHQWYANLLSIQGRHDEAIAQAGEARQRDPLSVGTVGFVGYTLYRARRFDEALSECRRTVEFHKGAPIAAWFLALVLLQLGRPAEAEEHLLRTLDRSRGAAMHRALLGFAQARAGHRAEARTALQELLETAKSRYVSPIDLSTICLGLGDRDGAVEWLQKAFAERVMRVTELPMPLFDDVRDDPRLADLRVTLGVRQFGGQLGS